MTRSSAAASKPALSHAQAVASIRGGSGTHFDPDVVDAFLAVEAEFREIAERYADDADQLDQERARLKLVFGQLRRNRPRRSARPARASDRAAGWRGAQPHRRTSGDSSMSATCSRRARMCSSQ